MSLHHHHHRRLLDSNEDDNGRLFNFNTTIHVAIVFVVLSSMMYIAIDLIRYCIKRRQRRQPIMIQSHQNRTRVIEVQRPVTQPQLDALPVLIHGVSLPASQLEETCSVCLGEFVAGEEVRVMPKCLHMFHRECIDRWLTTLSSLCPICREPVIGVFLEQATSTGLQSVR